MTVYRLEAAFGYGPFDLAPDDSTPGAWVDLTGLLNGPSGPQITVDRGHDLDASPLTPGTLTVRLYAGDGDLDTYDLRPGIPIRLTGDGERLFTGWAARWPAVRDAGSRWVDLEAHDLGGLLAHVDAPTSALAADIADSRPDAWWRPGPSGWGDQVSGRFGRSTGPYVEAETPLAAGETSWIPDATGAFGVLPGELVNLADTTRRQVIGCIIQPAEGLALATTYLVAQRHASGAHLALRVTWSLPTLPRWELTIAGDGWQASLDSDDDRFGVWPDRGASLSVVVAIDHSDEVVQIFVGGSLVATGPILPGPALDTNGAIVSVGGDLGSAATDRSTVPIDQLVTWSNWQLGDVGTWSEGVQRSARLAWSGEALDARIRRILNASGVTDQWLDLGPASVVTQQGYRTGDLPGLLGKIADTEQGTMVIDRYGRLTFRGRSHWIRPAAYLGDETAPDVDGAAPLPIVHESAETIDGDLAGIVNVAQVTAEHGLMQTVTDPASIARYGRRSPIHLSGLLHPTDRQSRAVAEWLVYSRAEPIRAVAEFALDTTYPGTDLHVIGPLDVGDGLIVAADGIPPTLARILTIRHEITATAHVTTYTVTTAHHNLIDDHGLGRPHEWLVIGSSPLGTAALSF